MKDAIKSISLDDIGDMRGSSDTKAHGEVDKQKDNLNYTRPDMPGKNIKIHNPQYTAATQATQSPQTNNSFSPSSMSAIGTEVTGLSMVTSRLSQILGSLEKGKKRRLYVIGGGLVLVLIGAFLFFGGFPMSGEEESLSMGEASNLTSPPLPEAPKDLAGKSSPQDASAATKVSASGSGAALGPYDNLPNPLGLQPSEGQKLSPEQEDRWRKGLDHPFSYQRYKSVQDARSSKMKGSEFLMNEALNQPKFWTRMEALLGIAELGVEVDAEAMRLAIGDSRPSLVANYFRRFGQKTDEASFHVLRAAMRAAPPQARQVILQKLAQSRSPVNDLYLIAASHDAVPEIKAIADSLISKQAVSEELNAQYQRLASGAEQPQAAKPALAPEVLAAPQPMPSPPRAELTPLEAKDMKVEELRSPEVDVEEVYLNENGTKSSGAGKSH